MMPMRAAAVIRYTDGCQLGEQLRYFYCPPTPARLTPAYARRRHECLLPGCQWATETLGIFIEYFCLFFFIIISRKLAQ